MRRVELRAEQDGSDRRFLDASVVDGSLRIDGQDLGPATSPVSSDGEYEWSQTVQAEDIPHLIELLGGEPGESILDLLDRSYTGRNSYELERILRESDIQVRLWTYGG